MAKDDYHVIVYQILTYLYQRLKKGERLEASMLDYKSPLFEKINRQYWAYIIYQISKMELIEGVTFVPLDGLSIPYAVGLEDCMITPKGIEYLCDNSFMEKAKGFLKEMREIIPFS